MEPKQRHGDIAEVRRQRLDLGVSEAQRTCRAGYRKGGNSTYCLGEGVARTADREWKVEKKKRP